MANSAPELDSAMVFKPFLRRVNCLTIEDTDNALALADRLTAERYSLYIHRGLTDKLSVIWFGVYKKFESIRRLPKPQGLIGGISQERLDIVV